jgi:hypothetical protein
MSSHEKTTLQDGLDFTMRTANMKQPPHATRRSRKKSPADLR